MKVHTMLKKNITLPLSILLAGCARKAIAVCPMCTLAVGAGVGVARWLGIDNSITGLWIGGFTLSISIWTIDFLDRHGIKFFLKRVIVPALYYASVIIPLYHKDLFCRPGRSNRYFYENVFKKQHRSNCRNQKTTFEFR